MVKHSVDALARELLEQARRVPAGRASRTLVGGHEQAMRQTVVALLDGQELAEHDNPGQATLLVLRGRVVLHAGTDTWDGRVGDLIEIPPARHSVAATEDAVVLLSAVPRERGQASN
jgi:quercetin dioxygenase-like cupin family protein